MKISKKEKNKLALEIFSEAVDAMFDEDNEDSEETCKTCINCMNCIPIGEGDHICDMMDTPVLVLEDYCPTDDYYCCGGADYEEL